MKSTAFGIDLYELLSCIIPGAIAVWAACSLTHGPLDVSALSSTFDAVAFLMASYVAGTFFQTIGSWLEGRYNSLQDGYPSDRLLSDEDQTYSPEFKSRLRKLAEKRFGLGPAASSQQLFGLCYSYTQVRGIDEFIQVMNRNYGFFRGLMVACLIGMGLFGLKIALLAQTSGWFTSELQSYLAIALFFFTGAYLSFTRWQLFRQRFADHVYRTFYVACTMDERLVFSPRRWQERDMPDMLDVDSQHYDAA